VGFLVANKSNSWAEKEITDCLVAVLPKEILVDISIPMRDELSVIQHGEIRRFVVLKVLFGENLSFPIESAGPSLEAHCRLRNFLDST